MKEIKLRPWQADAQRQAIDWYNNEDNKHFIISGPWLREDHMCFGNSKRINQK